MAWQAPVDGLREAGLSPSLIDNILKVRSQDALEKVLAQIQAKNIQVLTWEEAAYPARLMQIDQPPPVLYLRGEFQSDDQWAVAIVGTRRMTAYGRQVADDVATALAHAGVTVVSGLARGVDAAAHQAALKAGGRSWGVLGSGVDCIYPPEHERLANQMLNHGGVMSDYPPGTPPDGPNFPPRNRIISGLSIATLVVEAGVESGALITAKFALEQGREVFAVPGSIYAVQSTGTNRLIQDGARPLLHPREILEALNLNRVVEHRAARSALPSDPIEARLFQALGPEPVHVDELCRQTELPIEKVTATLALMELKGMARQAGGMSYVRVHEQPAEYRAKNGTIG